MDVDKSLDDIASEKKAAARPARGTTRPPTAPRTSSGPARGARDNNGGGAIQNTPYNRPPPPRNPDGAWTHDLYSKSTAPSAQYNNHRGSLAPPPSSRIVISNIHYEVTESDLKSIFQRVGTLVFGPKLRYDRSGRSMGVANAEYATAKSARDAINQFDGNLAKGQALQIKFDDTPPRRAPGSAQAAPSGPFASFGGGRGAPGLPTPGSLLNRIDGGKSLAADGAGAGAGANGGAGRGQAPIGGFRMGRGLARGTAGRGRGGATGGRPVKSAPKTAEDLDKELEGYHGITAAAPAPATPAVAVADGDVEMA